MILPPQYRNYWLDLARKTEIVLPKATPKRAILAAIVQALSHHARGLKNKP